jgi:hypothetical protein
MTALREALRIDLRRAFRPPVFLGVIALIVVMNYLGVAQEYYGNPSASVVYLFTMFIRLGAFAVIATVYGALPYANGFCVDWKQQFIRANVVRTTRNAYAWSKVIAVGLSAFVVVFAGYLLTILLFKLHMPLVGTDFAAGSYATYDPGVYGPLLSISPGLYMLVTTCVTSLSCMFWAVYALLVSAYCVNRFVALSAPIITYYLVGFVAGRGLPPYLSLNSLDSGGVDLGGPLPSLLYVAAFFLVLSVLAGLLFCQKVKWRLANG